MRQQPARREMKQEDAGSDQSPAFYSFFRCCEQSDAYGAAGEFFGLLQAPATFDLTIDLDGTPQITASSRVGAASAADAIKLYCTCRSDNQATAHELPAAVEAIILGTVRFLCVQQEFEAANRLLADALSAVPRTIHLRAAEHAIGQLLSQSSVHPALQKFVGNETEWLHERFCPIPFARADVHQNGEVVMCCTHWLPTSIGNVFNDSSSEILNSNIAQEIRKSVIDGSYKYCSHSDCQWIVNGELPKKADYLNKSYIDNDMEVPAKVLQNAFTGTSYDIDNVSFLVFCLDRTCNLSCPSCRVDVIMVKGEERDKLYQATQHAVLPMLRGAKRAMINPAGEVFVSRPSRRVLEALAGHDYANVVVDIITNGSVCTKEEWDKFSHLYGRINFVRVSMDGCTKETFEKLRRKAEFEQVVTNLRNIAAMRAEKKIKHFSISFTYQRDNVHEMQKFVEFGKSLPVSVVIFERLQMVQGAFTEREFRERAVHLVDHPLHSVFLRQAKAVKNDPMVSIDWSF